MCFVYRFYCYSQLLFHLHRVTGKAPATHPYTTSNGGVWGSQMLYFTKAVFSKFSMDKRFVYKLSRFTLKVFLHNDVKILTRFYCTNNKTFKYVFWHHRYNLKDLH